MPEKFRRHFLKAKDSKEFLEKASKRLGVDIEHVFKTKVNVELIQTESLEIYLINNKPVLFKSGENVFPTLMFNEFSALAPKVVVDMGAIPHVCNGADVMAPGIRRYERDSKKGDLVFIADEKHGKLLAVGEIMYDTEEAKKIKQGIIVKNIHFVGDKIWNFIKNLEVRA